MLPCQMTHLIKLRYESRHKTSVVSNKQDKIIKMTRQHREIQDRVMKAYQKREKEFLKKIQEELMREEPEEPEDPPALTHG